MTPSTVVVVGAGVSGLSTAICAAEGGLDVTVVTEELPGQTTSAVASAMCGPVIDRGDDPIVDWERVTIAEMVALAASDPVSGVHVETGLLADRQAGPPPPVARSDLPALIPAARDELPTGYASGVWATLPLVDMPRYLDHLQRRLAAAGGVIEQRRVSDLTELVGSVGQVVNCTGVFARTLVPDPEVHSSWGQHVVVQNPGITGFFMEAPGRPTWAAYWAHGERVVLGGIAAPDEWSRTPSPEVAEGIVARCAVVAPWLRDATVLECQTGLRPARSRPRLEVVSMRGGRLVHNYGHGGSGVSLSWGCAREAVRLLTQ